MNPPTPPRSSPGHRWWLWIIIPLGVLLVGLLGLVVGAWNSVRLGPDSRALKASVRTASGIAWKRQVEFSVGAIPLGLARMGATFVRQIPPEAKLALRAIRSVEVGVYEAPVKGRQVDPMAVLDATDSTMTARGWERVVGVSERDQVVGIYMPRDLSSPRDVQLCVMVMDGPELVVVSVRGNFEAVMEFVHSRPEWRERFRPLAQR